MPRTGPATAADRLINFTQGSCPFAKIEFNDFSRTFQGPYEGYIKRTILNQTGTFTSIFSIYKRPKLPQRWGVQGEAPAENGFYAHLRSERSHLEHLFQYKLVQLWRFRKSNSSTFKDLQTQIRGLSRTMSVFKDFPGLENLEKNSRTFKDW